MIEVMFFGQLTDATGVSSVRADRWGDPCAVAGAGGGVELPFGGSGLSGHGREKGFEALYGFTTLKTVAAYHG